MAARSTSRLQRIRDRLRSGLGPYKVPVATAAVGAVVGAVVTFALGSALADEHEPVEVVVQPAPAPEEPQCGGLSAFGRDEQAPATGVYVRVLGGCWSQLLGYVPSGSELEYAITYRNATDERHDDVTLRADLPPGVRLVSGSTTWHNASHPGGVDASSDDLENVGINVGSYDPGANAWATFRVTIPGPDEAACGVSEYRVEGFAAPWGAEVSSNVAVLSATRAC